MIEVYRDLGAETVNRDFIVLDSTKNRMLTFDFIFAFLLGLPILILILSYNTLEISSMIILFTLVITVIVLNKYKASLCYKTICFDRKAGQIRIKRGFPKVDDAIKFPEVKFSSRTHYVGADSYQTVSLKNKNKKYRLYDTSKNINHEYFIRGFMRSDKYLLKRIVDYNRDDDKELEAMMNVNV
jgi:hypothetical protein